MSALEKCSHLFRYTHKYIHYTIIGSGKIWDTMSTSRKLVCVDLTWKDTKEVGNSDSSGMEGENERKGKQVGRETYFFF